jgi:hypothetical protein
MKKSQTDRLLDTMRIIEAITDKVQLCNVEHFALLLTHAQGVLTMRRLETMKRTSSAAKLEARNNAGKKPCQPKEKEKIPTTGVLNPSQLGAIASSLKASKAEFDGKRPHICPVPKCKDRYVYRSGLEAHMKTKHPGFPLPPTLESLNAKLRDIRELEAECAAAGFPGAAAAVMHVVDEDLVEVPLGMRPSCCRCEYIVLHRR